METFNNKPYNSERHNGASNPRACYSSLASYGVNGLYQQTIINPRPASVTPQLFWRHPPTVTPPYLVRNQNPPPQPRNFNDIPYKKM